MMILDRETFGCALSNGYSKTRSGSVRRMQSLDGRPRYRLINRAPSYLFNVSYDFSEEQFAAFQSFWYSTAALGQPFQMHLKITNNPSIEEPVLAVATQPYTAMFQRGGWWQVSFEVEVSEGVQLTSDLCHVYWAGTPGFPADDDINANPIDNLPPAVIDPCPEVLPNV